MSGFNCFISGSNGGDITDGKAPLYWAAQGVRSLTSPPIVALTRSAQISLPNSRPQYRSLSNGAQKLTVSGASSSPSPSPPASSPPASAPAPAAAKPINPKIKNSKTRVVAAAPPSGCRGPSHPSYRIEQQLMNRTARSKKRHQTKRLAAAALEHSH